MLTVLPDSLLLNKVCQGWSMQDLVKLGRVNKEFHKRTNGVLVARRPLFVACLAIKRFSKMDLELLNQAFGGHADEDRPCVLKRCLKIQCAKLSLDCLECNEDEDKFHDTHLVIVNSFNEWQVENGTKLEAPGFTVIYYKCNQ